jgi:hypothetical protein
MISAVPERPARGEASVTLTWGSEPVSESCGWDGTGLRVLGHGVSQGVRRFTKAGREVESTASSGTSQV